MCPQVYKVTLIGVRSYVRPESFFQCWTRVTLVNYDRSGPHPRSPHTQSGTVETEKISVFRRSSSRLCQTPFFYSLRVAKVPSVRTPFSVKLRQHTTVEYIGQGGEEPTRVLDSETGAGGRQVTRRNTSFIEGKQKGW